MSQTILKVSQVKKLIKTRPDHLPTTTAILKNKSGVFGAVLLCLLLVLICLYASKSWIAKSLIEKSCLNHEIVCVVDVDYIGSQEIGIHSLTVEKSGFQSLEAENIRLGVNWPIRNLANIQSVEIGEIRAQLSSGNGQDVEGLLTQLKEIVQFQDNLFWAGPDVQIDRFAVDIPFDNRMFGISGSVLKQDDQAYSVSFQIPTERIEHKEYSADVSLAQGTFQIYKDYISGDVSIDLQNAQLEEKFAAQVTGHSNYRLDTQTLQLETQTDIAFKNFATEKLVAETVIVSASMRASLDQPNQIIEHLYAEGLVTASNTTFANALSAKIKAQFEDVFPSSVEPVLTDISVPFQLSGTKIEGLVVGGNEGIDFSINQTISGRLGRDNPSPENFWSFNVESQVLDFEEAFSVRGKGYALNAENMKLNAGPDAFRFEGDVHFNQTSSAPQWRFIDADMLNLKIASLEITSDFKKTQFSLDDAVILFSGPAFNADWQNVRLAGDWSGQWKDGRVFIDPHQILNVEVGGFQTHSAKVSGFSAVYHSDNISITNRVLSGSGSLSGLETQVQRLDQTYDVDIGKTRLNWTFDEIIQLNAFVEDIEAEIGVGHEVITLSAPQTSIELAADTHWKIDGQVPNGQMQFHDVALKGIAADFLFSGSETGLEGEIRHVSAIAMDQSEQKRFADLNIESEFLLRDGQITGQLSAWDQTHRHHLGAGEVSYDIVLGEGQIDLTTGNLLFERKGLQPHHVFPRLKGIAANVAGGITFDGHIKWTPDNLSSNGIVELVDIGFVTPKAGLFEGVFGQIEFDDLLMQHSLPDQRIKIHKWNAGAPLENGVVEFQVQNFNEVNVQKSTWPFAKGFLLLEPVVWKTEAEVNQVVILADNIDLAGFLDDASLLGVHAYGTLSGQIAASVSTGHIKIDEAQFKSNSAGFIRYDTPAMQKLASTNENVALLVNALKNFKYDEMLVDVSGELTGEMLVNVFMAGRNLDFVEGHGFEMDVSIRSDLMALIGASSIAEHRINAYVQNIAAGFKERRIAATTAPSLHRTFLEH